MGFSSGCKIWMGSKKGVCSHIGSVLPLCRTRQDFFFQLTVRGLGVGSQEADREEKERGSDELGSQKIEQLSIRPVVSKGEGGGAGDGGPRRRYIGIMVDVKKPARGRSSLAAVSRDGMVSQEGRRVCFTIFPSVTPDGTGSARFAGDRSGGRRGRVGRRARGKYDDELMSKSCFFLEQVMCPFPFCLPSRTRNRGRTPFLLC